MQKIESHAKSVKKHYQQPNLSHMIAHAFKTAGKKIVSYEDTAALDEFHIRGREATRELAQLANIHRGSRVIDMGCGLGGPARLLAAEFDCIVTGIDLMPEFIQAAEMLTRMVGLSNRVVFHAGDMLNMPFDDSSFDMAWSQHTFMNIADKSRLFREMHRVLPSGGILAFYEIVTGRHKPMHYPVQWAGDAAINFLLTQAQLIEQLESAGFEKVSWQDTTNDCLTWFQGMVKHMVGRPQTSPLPLGLNLVIGPTTAQKAINTARNLEEDRIRVVYGVLRNTKDSQI